MTRKRAMGFRKFCGEKTGKSPSAGSGGLKNSSCYREPSYRLQVKTEKNNLLPKDLKK